MAAWLMQVRYESCTGVQVWRTSSRHLEGTVAAPTSKPDRYPVDDAKARVWAERTRRQAEAGELSDDAAYLARKLDEEKRKLKRR